MLVALSALSVLLANTVAEIASFTDEDYRINRGINLSGCVRAVQGDMFILEDETGRALLRSLQDIKPPTVGSVISVSCFGVMYDDLICQIRARNFTVIGQGEPAVPIATSVSQIASGTYDYAHVRLRAKIINVLPDDIQPDNVFLQLSDGTNAVIAVCRERWIGGLGYDATQLIGAEVEITGLVSPHLGHWRRFQGRGIDPFAMSCEDYLKIVTPPPADPFAAPPCNDRIREIAQNPSLLGRRTAAGRVIAVWHGDRFLLETNLPRRKHVQVSLLRGTPSPAFGDIVEVVGLPRTDLFSLTLVQSLWRPAPETKIPHGETNPVKLSARDLFTNKDGQNQVQSLRHGQVIRLTGLVRSLPPENWNDNFVQLLSDGWPISVDASACPGAFRDVTPDCTVEVSGVCLLQTDPWQSDMPVPSVRGFVLVVRSPADVQVLARPPWWTPTRLMAALGVLFAATLLFFIWNRILGRIVIRRSRELAREQIARDAADLKVGERTRLAVELHDSLSQNLEGLACQVTALDGVLTADPKAARACLKTARQMLASCRTELRSCLFDLRGRALEATTFDEALRTTLKPFAVSVELTIRFPVRTSLFGDSVIHSVLCIVRELVSNAIRHGQARHVRIAGERQDEMLRFSVDEDGRGFDPARCPGVESGHFGLVGLRTRVERLGGSIVMDASPGHGSYTRVTLTRKKT